MPAFKVGFNGKYSPPCLVFTAAGIKQKFYGNSALALYLVYFIFAVLPKGLIDMRLPFFVCLMFIPVFSQLLIAQNGASIEYSNEVEHTIKYIDSEEKDIAGQNFIIEQIARSIPKILEYTEFKIFFKLHLRLDHIDSTDRGGKASIDNIRCSGDVYYKGLHFADVLLPEQMDLLISINTPGKNQIREYIFNINPLANENPSFTFQFIDSLKNKDYTFFPCLKNVVYSLLNKEAFLRKKALARKYFELDPRLPLMYEEIKAINTERITMIPVYDFRLDEIEKEIAEIDQLDMENSLYLHKADPINFTHRFAKIKQLAEKQRVILDQYLSHMDYWYYREGMKYLSKKDTMKAKEFFDKSLLLNPFYTPAHYQFAHLHFLESNYKKAADIILEVLDEMNPDKTYKKRIIGLGNQVQEHLIISAKHLINDSLYQEALSLLYTDLVFCDNSTYIECHDSLLLLINKSKQGIYYSYLCIAEKALENDKLHLAKTYADKAKSFQHENTDAILNLNTGNIVYHRIIHRSVIIGQAFESQNDLTEARKYYSHAKSVLRENPDIDYQGHIPEM